MIDYDTFYKDKSIEIPKINISDISNDLKIPKESVRRKLQELEKSGVIKKTGKKIFVDRSAFTTAKAEQTLKELSILISKFNEILVDEKVTNNIFDTNEILESIKTNFSFCWYQFYKLLFVFANDSYGLLNVGVIVGNNIKSNIFENVLPSNALANVPASIPPTFSGVSVDNGTAG